MQTRGRKHETESFDHNMDIDRLYHNDQCLRKGGETGRIMFRR